MNVPDDVLATILAHAVSVNAKRNFPLTRELCVAATHFERVCRRWRRLLVGTLHTDAPIDFWRTAFATVRLRRLPSTRQTPSSHRSYSNVWLDGHGGSVVVPFGGPTVTKKRAYIRLAQRHDFLRQEWRAARWRDLQRRSLRTERWIRDHIDTQNENRRRSE